MMCDFHRAERTIERDGGTILQVRLHEDHIGTLGRGNLFQRIDCSASNTFAPMSVRDSKIVDIDLAPLLLKFLQYVCGKTTDNSLFHHRYDNNEMFLAEQVCEVLFAWNSMLVCFAVIEGTPKYAQQFLEQRDVLDRQLPIGVLGRDAHLQLAPGKSSCGTERGAFVRSSKNGFGRASPRIHQPTTFVARQTKTRNDGGGAAFDGSDPMAERS